MENKIKIIGFSGKIGSGKDYIAKNIFLNEFLKKYKNQRYLFLSFADSLKQVCSLQYNFNYNELYCNKTKESRLKLQLTGDDYKKKYGIKCFINSLEMSIKLHSERSDINLFLIPDVRYPAEYELIKKLGGKILRIESPERTAEKLKKECGGDTVLLNKIKNHSSEVSLDNYNFDFVIKNNFNDKPENKIKEFLERF